MYIEQVWYAVAMYISYMTYVLITSSARTVLYLCMFVELVNTSLCTVTSDPTMCTSSTISLTLNDFMNAIAAKKPNAW